MKQSPDHIGRTATRSAPESQLTAKDLRIGEHEVAEKSYVHTTGVFANPEDVLPFFGLKVRLGWLPHQTWAKDLFRANQADFMRWFSFNSQGTGRQMQSSEERHPTRGHSQRDGAPPLHWRRFKTLTISKDADEGHGQGLANKDGTQVTDDWPTFPDLSRVHSASISLPWIRTEIVAKRNDVISRVRGVGEPGQPADRSDERGRHRIAT